MLRALGLTLLLLPAFAGTAHALPRAHPPDVKVLRAQGVRVDWPLTASARFPANRVATLAVSVKSPRRAVKLSLAAVDSRGRDVERFKVERLRRGTFATELAGRSGERFALRLDVGGKRYGSWITLADDPGFACEHGDAAGPAISVEPTVLRADQAFAIRFANPGDCTLGVAEWTDVAWERATPEGGWEPVQLDCATGDVWTSTGTTTICDSLPNLHLVAPKTERTLTREVPGGLTPGHYRLTINYSYFDTRVPVVQREVDVVA
ncbi:hypothetical protein OM076_35155 [Solirubrobacter ginsenosidimutans]|uniref:Uncharacterized protein n=1 Tax=Solirubrobacter ginsenosidimutans TaxID=490573 RepID=A0A9X3MYY3_9ACTN|nr:hypothetical protein [Solirubrobacter ginsenosidimutans]MDA0165561.1 hypothetical protein [Solirubrobacter ginsenosidimutans]